MLLVAYQKCAEYSEARNQGLLGDDAVSGVNVRMWTLYPFFLGVTGDHTEALESKTFLSYKILKLLLSNPVRDKESLLYGVLSTVVNTHTLTTMLSEECGSILMIWSSPMYAFVGHLLTAIT